MIPATTLITIETALINTVSSHFAPLIAATVKKAADEYDASGTVAAINCIDSMVLDEDLDGVREQITYLTKIVMTFGASRVSSLPAATFVGMGHEDETVQHATSSFLALFLIGVKESLKAAIPRFISSAMKEESPRILRPFESFVNDDGKSYINIVSSLHNTRVAAYGFVSEAYAMGYSTYAINEQLDARTCKVCKMMHGKEFSVRDAKTLLSVVLRTTDPEVLKTMQPWPKQDSESLAALNDMTSEELVSKGYHIPPFHPLCRGLLAKTTKVPSLTNPPRDAGKYQATASDFTSLGFKVPKAGIDAWNSKVGISPVDVISTLTGTTPELLTKAIMSESDLSEFGIKTLAVQKGVSTVGVTSVMHGSVKPVSVEVSMGSKSKMLSIDSVLLSSSDTKFKVIANALRGMYMVAQDAGAIGLETDVGGVVGGYGWAKLGFVPNHSSWKKLRGVIQRKFKALQADSSLPSIYEEVVSLILASPDPAAIQVLSEVILPVPGVTTLGQYLLEGTEWHGYLPFSDKVSVTKFMTYVGGSNE